MLYTDFKGLQLSQLGFGLMRLPTLDDDPANIDIAATEEMVDYALDHGINYFDTAWGYHMGNSETVLGNALKRHPRDSYHIATKLSNMNGDMSQKTVLAMYYKSFQELQTDYIDYYLLHNVSDYNAFKRRFEDNGVIDYLLEERKAGRIRNLGFSFHGGQQGFDDLIALHDKYHWDFVQIQLNYVDWTHAGGWNTDAQYLQGELDKRGIQSVIMEPLLGGRLANVPVHIADRLKERGPQNSIASWAFRFAGTHEGVLCVLSGMTYMEHLVDNLKSFSPLKPLTEEELAFLEETATLMQDYPTIPCTDCQYCMPCPYGIDIPTIFKHYNKCVNEGDIAQSIESESYKKARRAYLVSYDRAVPKLRQASRCIGCGQCTHHCPQHIRIPQELHKIDRYVENLKKNTL
jgi:predicted aldo/keto reductase-like oxidoreductase